MVRVLLFSESRYPINRRVIKKTIVDTLEQKGVSTSVEVSVAIVGDRKMKSLNEKYRGKEGTTDVLSFSQTEGMTGPQTDVMRLGDVVLSFPQVVKNAAKKDVLVDEEINFLVKHGLEHLLGSHHEE